MADALARRRVELAQHDQWAGLTAPALSCDCLDDVVDVRHRRRPFPISGSMPYRRGYCSTRGQPVAPSVIVAAWRPFTERDSNNLFILITRLRWFPSHRSASW